MRDDLYHDLAESLASFAALRTTLERQVSDLTDNPRDLVDELLSKADEFGIDHAIVDGRLSRAEPELVKQLAALLDAAELAQSRVDEALLAREAFLRKEDPSRAQRISVQGEIYQIDATDRENPQLVRDGLEEPTLTQSAARDVGLEPVEPLPDRDRTRSR